ncbi:MAG: hypothetical protein DBX59_05890 [Bacillota bacterium]|nr:MAG: hypothetical protein DBX59_05890 [Bacillota bacterium]
MIDPRQKIDKLRLERKWSQSKLAREIGISVTSVYNWYNDKNSMPTIRVLENVCTLFDIDMVELFADVEYDKLSVKEIELLEMFKQLNDTQQENVISIIKNISAAEKEK